MLQCSMTFTERLFQSVRVALVWAIAGYCRSFRQSAASMPEQSRRQLLFRDEIVAPVLVAARLDDEAQALHLANGTGFA